MKVRRGEIWYAEFGWGVGSEQSGDRPVLIIQNDVGNEFSPTVIVAALTDSRKRGLPTHVSIGKDCGIKKESVVMMEQLRTIDKQRLSSRIAVVPAAVMERVDYALQISVGIIPAKVPAKFERR